MLRIPFGVCVTCTVWHMYQTCKLKMCCVTAQGEHYHDPNLDCHLPADYTCPGFVKAPVSFGLGMIVELLQIVKLLVIDANVHVGLDVCSILWPVVVCDRMQQQRLKIRTAELSMAFRKAQNCHS